MRRTPAPWTRATVLGATSGTMGCAAHALAGGAVPPALVVVCVLGLVPLLRLLTTRELTGLRLLGLVGLVQVALHLVLQMACGSGNATQGPARSLLLHTVLCGVAPGQQPPSRLISPSTQMAMTQTGMPGHGLTVGMLGAHAAAVLAVSVLLRLAESHVWAADRGLAVLRGLGRRLVRALHLVVLVRVAPQVRLLRARADLPVRVLHDLFDVGGLSWRGPPGVPAA